MNDKQYLEAVRKLIEDYVPHITELTVENTLDVRNETRRRQQALKAQEDNIKSDMWEEKK